MSMGQYGAADGGQSGQAPAGWYPQDDGTQRYWDGSQWTEHTAPGNGAQQGYGTAPTPASSAHLVGAVTDVTSDDRQMAMLAHLLTLLAGFLAPLVIWLTKREESAYLDYHGKEALNFQISMMIYWTVAIFASFLLIGLLFLPVLFVLQILFPILAGIASNRGEYYRYPLTIRVIS